MTPEIVEVLKQGGLVLTVTHRLGRHLLHQYGQIQQAGGAQVWETPQVVSWSLWCDELWSSLGPEEEATPLASHQVKALWQEVVARSPEAESLLNPANTATMAAKAYDLLCQWRLDLSAIANFDHPDVQAFGHWARDYQQRCRHYGWLDQHERLTQLADAIAAGRLSVPRRIVWAGFDALTPQQQYLIDALERADCQVSNDTLMPAEARAVRFACSDALAELRAAAAWAGQRLSEDEASTIAIVVPELAALRNDVVRIFDEALCPAVALNPADSVTRPYNLSYGTPLADVPVVATALQLLALTRSPMELPALGRLIQSPFLGGAERELGPRALLDAALRRRGDGRYSVADLLCQMERSDNACPILAQGLGGLRQVAGGLPRRQRPSAWVGAWRALLKASGWPGERTLSSAEFQAINVWNGLLVKFASLDLVMGEIDFGDALARLKQMAADQPFQLKTPQTRVQILGLLEAGGLTFDHLWVTGLDDESWPAPAKPNPFLPLSLQRKVGMPHASAERELLFARQLTQRLLGAAAEVIVSHPAMAGDRALRPSPLITPLPPWREPIATAPGCAARIQGAAELESLIDTQGEAWPEGVRVAGGSAIFTDQAACPFRAFATHRLGARPLETPEPGLNAARRGTLIHRVMERFWRDLRGRDALAALSETELEARIATVVREVVERAARRDPHIFTGHFRALEQGRLTRLVRAWLAQELARQSFTIVSTEERRSVRMGGVAIEISADRIDRLDEDGREMVIDYKTGRVGPSAWFGERPDAPQLPLYAVTHERDVAALAFARLRPGECALEGVGDGVEVGGKVTDIGKQKAAQGRDWPQQMASWREVLARLGQDFRQGRAEVDPKERPKSCGYCALAGLCRINEIDTTT